MKRRWTALLLALMLLFSACGGEKTDDPAPVQPDDPAGTEQQPDDPAPGTDPAQDTPQLSPEEQALREKIAAMTLEEKVGQLFFVRCPESGAAEDVKTYHLGGLLLFGLGWVLAFTRKKHD